MKGQAIHNFPQRDPNKPNHPKALELCHDFLRLTPTYLSPSASPPPEWLRPASLCNAACAATASGLGGFVAEACLPFRFIAGCQQFGLLDPIVAQNAAFETAQIAVHVRHFGIAPGGDLIEPAHA